MSPFEVMYGKRFRIPTNWSSPEDKLMLVPDMLLEMEHVLKQVHQNLRALKG